MPTITNFGDANTVGNTTLQQNLTVQGAYSTFSGNLLASSATLGIGNATTRFGTLYAVTQNATTINTTAIYGTAGSVGINVASGLGATLQVQGNISATNSISTTNVIATNVNVTTTNTLSIYGPAGFVGINTSTPSGTSLYVSGNMFASNSLATTNVNVVTLNTTTANLLAIYGPTGFVGINTSAPSGTSLYVSGNMFVSNSLTTTNVSASGTISYTEDLAKRYPYLTPNTTNAASIQAWVSATCNAAGQPTKSWWATSATPVFGNVATGPRAGTSGEYAGSVLLPDGRVLFVPQDSSNVGFFNPTTGLFSTVVPTGLPATTQKFRGGVLVPNGNVIFVPFSLSNVGVFNPINYTYSNAEVGASGTLKFQGGVLGPTGNVIMIPRDNANIGQFNPTTLTMTNVGPIVAENSSMFGGGCLLPNGNVVMTPLTGTANIGMYNAYALTSAGFTNVGPISSTQSFECACYTPTGNVVIPPSTSTNIITYNPTFVSNPIGAGGLSNITYIGTAGANNFYQGTALLPSGNVIFTPTDASNIGMYDPVALSFSNAVRIGTTFGGQKFFGSSLLPDGRVVFCPLKYANVGMLETQVPAPPEFCLHPIFNKY